MNMWRKGVDCFLGAMVISPPTPLGGNHSTCISAWPNFAGIAIVLLAYWPNVSIAHVNAAPTGEKLRHKVADSCRVGMQVQIDRSYPMNEQHSARRMVFPAHDHHVYLEVKRGTWIVNVEAHDNRECHMQCSE
jgi:hypothetical protein